MNAVSMDDVMKRCLSYLTFCEIEKELSRHPALILPLGGCEPYGECGALGTATACAEALAGALAVKTDTLCAPALAFGCSTPYGAFGGTAGVKPRTMTNTLCETLRLWYGQGVRTVIIIDCLFDNGDAVGLALRRMKADKPLLKIISFSLQRDERIRAFIGRHASAREFGRSEYGMLSLAAFVSPDLVRPAQEKSAKVPADPKICETWRKRGADPQQFRKLFPACSISGAAGGFDAAFGKKLFDFVLQSLVDTVNSNSDK